MDLWASLDQVVQAALIHHDWDTVLDHLDRQPPEAYWVLAGCCLRFAMEESLETFRHCLNRLPPREYAVVDAMTSPWQDPNRPKRAPRWQVKLQGSLVLYAAAKGRAEHLKLLLERGHDVNGASPEASRALMERFGEHICGYGEEFLPFHPWSARPESLLQGRSDGEEDIIGSEPAVMLHAEGVTPLAAAVFFGQPECVEILLRHGAWREEAPSVSLMLMLPFRESDTAYQQARRLVLDHQPESGPRPLALWAGIRGCTAEGLEEELRRCDYPAHTIAQAACTLLGWGGSIRMGLWGCEQERQMVPQLLRILEQACPEGLEQPEVVRQMLTWHAMNRTADGVLELLLRRCEGKQIDLSPIGADLQIQRPEWAAGLIRTLARRCRCVIHRDSVLPETQPTVLKTLLGRVELLPPAARVGVSGMTQAILNTGDVKLIRAALEKGVIPPEESTEELLRCQRECDLPMMIRPLLLSCSRGGTLSPTLSEPACRYKYHWVPREGTELGETVWFDANCTDEKAMDLMSVEYNHLYWFELQGRQWSAGNLFHILCALGRTEVVRSRAERDPNLLRHISDMVRDRFGTRFTLTPLTAAAFAGETETVRTLLELGAAAQEQEIGSPSSVCGEWGCSENWILPMPPLLAAMLKGHWGTARLLLEHGAACDLNQDPVKELWRREHGTRVSLGETAARYLNDYLSGEGILCAGKQGDHNLLRKFEERT